MSVPIVVAVVTTFDAHDSLDRCVAALSAVGGVAHVVVVDNGGGARVVSGEHCTVVRSDHNGGFGAAANIGFAHARQLGAEVVVLLNDDVVVTEGWLTPLVDELAAASDVGAVQPLLVFAGPESEVVNSLGVAIGADGAGTDVGLGEPVESIDRRAHDIDVFTGGAVAFRPEFIAATGGFDERYFLYYEDVDLARRGARVGWRYRCVPAAIVEHEQGASTGSLGDRLVYLRERNRLWSAFRNEPVATIAGAVWLSIRRLRHRPYGVNARALLAGLVGGLWRLVQRGQTARNGSVRLGERRRSGIGRWTSN